MSERRTTSSPSSRNLLEQVRVREGSATPLPQEHVFFVNGCSRPDRFEDGKNLVCRETCRNVRCRASKGLLSHAVVGVSCVSPALGLEVDVPVESTGRIRLLGWRYMHSFLVVFLALDESVRVEDCEIFSGIFQADRNCSIFVSVPWEVLSVVELRSMRNLASLRLSIVQVGSVVRVAML